MVILACKRNLLQVVCALHSPRRLTRRLNGGKKQTDQNADDGNDNEKFNESEPFSTDFIDFSNDATPSSRTCSFKTTRRR